MIDRSWVCYENGVKPHGDRCSAWRWWFNGEAHGQVQMPRFSLDFVSDLEGWWVSGGNRSFAPPVEDRSQQCFEWYGGISAKDSFDGMAVPILPFGRLFVIGLDAAVVGKWEGRAGICYFDFLEIVK